MTKVDHRPAIHRFLERTEITPECWVWRGEESEDGYGIIHDSGKRKRAHRYAYETFLWPVPEGKVIDHTCRNRRCVNPAHLEVVSPEENNRRGNSFSALNGRKTHCPKGHPYDEANTFAINGKWRGCRACRKAKNNAQNAKRKAAKAATLTA